MPLGSAWAANSVNCVPFRSSGLISRGGIRYVSFYGAHGDVVVASVVAGAVAERVSLAAARQPFDAHLSISLGLDGDGYLHVAYGAHDSKIQLARSVRPGLSAGFSAPEWLSDACAQRASYPMFLSVPPRGELILLFRDGSFASGDIRVMRLNRTTHRWEADPVALISGRISTGFNRGPYLNTPVASESGRTVLFLVWRLSLDEIGVFGNTGIACLLSNDALRSLVDVGDDPLRLPVTPSTAQPAIPVPPNANLINQASAAWRGDGVPMVLSYWNDEQGIVQYRLGWCEKGRWTVSTVSRFKTRFELAGAGTLPLPHSRPELLVDPDGTAHVIFRSHEFDGRLVMTSLAPPHYQIDRARHRLLVDEDLGFYEPVVDREGWKSGELALYVQRCNQESGGDTMAEYADAEARLITWKRERLI